MKTYTFSIFSIAGIILLTGNVFGSEIRWRSPEASAPAPASVSLIPVAVAANDAFSVTITQVQHLEPMRTSLPMLPQPGVNPQSVNALPPLLNSASTQSREVTPCGDLVMFKCIRTISHDIRPHPGDLPVECVLESKPFYGRHFQQTCFIWKASALSTRAAYFEDAQLERHGHTKVPEMFQPFLSGARFFGTIPLLPYKMGVTPPNEQVYTLGHIRSGSRAPYMREPFPISFRGALFQFGAVTGGVFASGP